MSIKLDPSSGSERQPLTRPIEIQLLDGSRQMLVTIADAIAFLSTHLADRAGRVDWQLASLALHTAANDPTPYHVQLARNHVDTMCRTERMLPRLRR